MTESDSDRETVYVKGFNHGGNGLILHTDNECPRLNSARQVFEKDREVYPEDTPICSHCSGDVERAGGDNRGPWQALEEMDADDIATDGGRSVSDSYRGVTHCRRHGNPMPCSDCAKRVMRELSTDSGHSKKDEHR